MSRTIYKSLPDLALARTKREDRKTIREPRVVPENVKEFGEGRKFFIKTFG